MSDLELIRLSVHVTAATIWVGGQLVLATLVPVLRSAAPELVVVVARAFARVAWPAFAVLIITGIWNAVEIRHELHGTQGVVFNVKMVIVALSGLSALLHQKATSARWRAATGAGGAIFALLALVLGVQLTL